MRIVGGAAKGRRLAGAAAGTRPTSDQAREGLFNTLAGLLDLDGATVLDLYAGSGAVGLEALSRGAAAAVLVERDARAARVITANVADVGLPGARVVRADVGRFLAGPPQACALVFADPPYDLDETTLAAVLGQVGGGWVAPGGVVVVERSVRSPEPAWPTTLEPVRDRRYGETVLWYRRAS